MNSYFEVRAHTQCHESLKYEDTLIYRVLNSNVLPILIHVRRSQTFLSYFPICCVNQPINYTWRLSISMIRWYCFFIFGFSALTAIIRWQVKLITSRYKLLFLLSVILTLYWQQVVQYGIRINSVIKQIHQLRLQSRTYDSWVNIYHLS